MSKVNETSMVPQHHKLAIDGQQVPEPGGAPTSDVFEGGPSAGVGRVIDANGSSKSCEELTNSGDGGMARSNY